MRPEEAKKLTPMMAQWQELKASAGPSLLFFRLGDFYELFNEDAQIAAPVMGVALTTRGTKGDGEKAPLCGVPVGTVEAYLHKLLDRGYSVALAEQTEEAGPRTKLVKREIVQHFSPGIRMLPGDELPHYAACISFRGKNWTLAAADVSTGHVALESGTQEDRLQELIDRLPVEDLRIPFKEKTDLRVKYQRAYHPIPEKEAESYVFDDLALTDASDNPCTNTQELICLGSLFKILSEAHPQQRIRFLKPRVQQDCVWMSAPTRRHLNLYEPESENLYRLLNESCTSMGSRELRALISAPSTKREKIQERQALVREFRSNDYQRQQFRKHLRNMNDLHRALRRKREAPILFQIAKSLSEGLEASSCLDSTVPQIQNFLVTSEKISELSKKLSQSLQWSEHSESGWIKKGVSSTLDELREFQNDSNRLLSELEQRMRSETDISSLKIKFHQVFGYVFEVTALNKKKIPQNVKHVQSLANSERFKNEELSELEEKLLSLKTRIHEAEKAEIQTLYEQVDQNMNAILSWVEQLAQLDCFQALAEVSHQHAWVTPKTSTKEAHIKLKAARHPLSERSSFVPLEIKMKREATRLMLITGPNMAGKSTVLRVAALCSILHQIGSDVPAESAEISIFDRIMCRMGASDDLTQGKSTFFVEMREVAGMLHGATENSLLLFDEVGRGTSTFDGMSIAWSITECVHDLGCLSMVATHYLELAKLQNSLSHLKTVHLGVEEIDGRLIFTRQLEDGPASRSYGIQVARLADIPDRVLERATEKLKDFEGQKEKKKRQASLPLFEMMS